MNPSAIKTGCDHMKHVLQEDKGQPWHTACISHSLRPASRPGTNIFFTGQQASTKAISEPGSKDFEPNKLTQVIGGY